MEIEYAVDPLMLKWQAVQNRYERRTHITKKDYMLQPQIRAAAEFKAFVGVVGKVLSVGCGNGLISGVEYAKAGYECVDLVGNTVTGIDPSHPNYEKRFEVVRGFGEELPFDDNSFDAVIAFSMLDHVCNPAMCLSEFTRVSRNSVFVANNLTEKGHSDPKHVWIWSGDELLGLLNRYFKQENVKIFDKGSNEMMFYKGGCCEEKGIICKSA